MIGGDQLNRVVPQRIKQHGRITGTIVVDPRKLQSAHFVSPQTHPAVSLLKFRFLVRSVANSYVNTFRSSSEMPEVDGRASKPCSYTRDPFQGLQSTDRAPREEIQHRAYAIWQSEGEPDAHDLAHWLQAEAEVMHRT